MGSKGRLFIALTVLLMGAAPAGAISNDFDITLNARHIKVASIQVNASDKVKNEKKRWGLEDVVFLKKELAKKAGQALRARGLMDAKNGARLTLTIKDVTPNRPTLRALNQPRHLSFISSGLGGAEISARLIGPDDEPLGQVYGRWSETQLDELSIDNGTWFDARRAFDWFARHLAKALAGKGSEKGPDAE